MIDTIDHLVTTHSVVIGSTCEAHIGQVGNSHGRLVGVGPVNQVIAIFQPQLVQYLIQQPSCHAPSVICLHRRRQRLGSDGVGTAGVTDGTANPYLRDGEGIYEYELN